MDRQSDEEASMLACNYQERKRTNGDMMTCNGSAEGAPAQLSRKLQDRSSTADPCTLKSLENGQILLCFPQSGGSLESLNSLESLENGLF